MQGWSPSSAWPPQAMYLPTCLFNMTYLEVDDDQDHNDSGDQVGHIRRVLSVECLLQSVESILLSEQEVEECDDSAFKLGSLIRADGDGREGLPQDDLADIGGDEQGDAASETVTLLEELVKQDHDDAREGQLEDDDAAIQGSNLVDGAVHA